MKPPNWSLHRNRINTRRASAWKRRRSNGTKHPTQQHVKLECHASKYQQGGTGKAQKPNRSRRVSRGGGRQSSHRESEHAAWLGGLRAGGVATLQREGKTARRGFPASVLTGSNVVQRNRNIHIQNTGGAHARR